MKHRIWRDLPTEQELRKKGMTQKKILDAVTEYHAVRKPLLANIQQRIVMLRLVIDACNKSVGHSGGLFSKKVELPMDKGVASVMNRAIAKRDYLNVLWRHYNSDYRGEILDPLSLITRIEAAQQVQGKLLGITQHNALEKLDPVHRSWHENNSFFMSGDGHYVSAWTAAVRDGSCQEPFFIYLEDTPHCLEAEYAKNVRSVVYHSPVKYRQGEIPVWYLKDEAGELRMVHPVSNLNQPFDTQWVTKSEAVKGGDDHTLAYVFTAQKELIADVHSPTSGGDTSTFHHSSFTAGSLVRCAGMIGGKAGKVVHISNHSGHYQPPVENLKRLVRHLNKKNVFAPDAKVETGADRHYQSVADFLAI